MALTAAKKCIQVVGAVVYLHGMKIVSVHESICSVHHSQSTSRYTAISKGWVCDMVCLSTIVEYWILLFPQANVLVSYDGKPKLADFGLTITQESKLRLSETDPAGGTLRWMVSDFVS